jgi:tetratricopeptide (TPR) repeat protein
MTSVGSLLAVYPPVPRAAALSDAVARQRMEHVHRLAPAGEGAERAWTRLAEYWQSKGDDAAARVWHERAAEAGRRSLFLATLGVQLTLDRLTILAMASLLAGAVVIAALAHKYSLNLARASGRERATLVLMAAAAWLSVGLAGVYLRAIERAQAEPLHVGEIGGPDDIAFFSGRLPESPERDLLAAIAYQMTGDLTESERRYRLLPQFAVSWNNLGVVLTRTRRADEARKAFERALELAPDLPEALLNTDKLPPTLETGLHQKYAPVRKMMALPGREHVLRAYMGREWTWWYRAMVAGPLRDLGHLRGRPGSGESIGAGALRLGVLLLALVASAITLVAPFLARGSASAPLPRPWERVVPGLAPWWGWAGGPVLLLWCGSLVAIALAIAKGAGVAFTAAAGPDLVATFGLLPGAPTGTDVATPSLLTMGSLFVLLSATTWVISGRERN